MSIDTPIRLSFIPEDLSLSAEQWKDKHGYWIAHPKYPINDWRYEVVNSDTRQGYWEWAFQREEED